MFLLINSYKTKRSLKCTGIYGLIKEWHTNVILVSNDVRTVCIHELILLF